MSLSASYDAIKVKSIQQIYTSNRHSVLFRTIIIFVFFLYPLVAEPARIVSEKRECAICHIAWISDFKKDDRTTLIAYEPRPVVETGRQDVVSTEMMCFSCHDGFVLDSRSLWLNKEHTHPVGVVPSENVRLPKEEGKTIFPLNDDGKVYCGTCHSAHGIDWSETKSPLFLRMQNINSSLCKTCHVDRTESQNSRHNHPIDQKVSEGARQLIGIGSKLSQKSEVICQSCHLVHDSTEDKLLVVNNDRSQLCIACHQDKSNATNSGNKQHFTHPVNTSPKNLTIPTIFADSGAKFGPNGEIECQTCHKLHLAPSQKLLVLESTNLTEGVCINCHKDKRSVLSAGHNLLGKAAEITLGEKNQPGSNLGVCGVCHNAHNGKGPNMWARQLPPNSDLTASLCLSCHSNSGPANNHTVGFYSHPVGSELVSNMKPNGLPLFTSMGRKTYSTKYGRITCATCHDVHGPASQLNIDASSINKKDGTGKYLRKGEGNLLSLCKTCHEDKLSIKNTKHDIEANSDASMPLGVCSNCHQVHNAKGPRMWARDTGVDTYDTSTLCRDCHQQNGQAKDKTTGSHSHPIGVSVNKSGIRVTPQGWVEDVAGVKITTPPQLPLYDNNGNKLKKGEGLVGCGTCHDPHVWSPASTKASYATKKDQEGDARNSFLRIPSAPDGSLCITCHKSKTTIRDTEHDLSITVPEATNNLGEGLTQSGICGQCHAVHNAVQDLALWARPPGPADNRPEMLCRSCHRKTEIARAKVPEKASHPTYVMAWDGDLRDSDKKGITHLPVFSDSGSKAMTGYITCPTCHNVHQWRPTELQKGPGENQEGDIFSSFLRLRSTENMLCTDCHGGEALFRYKYFHGDDFKKSDKD